MLRSREYVYSVLKNGEHRKFVFKSKMKYWRALSTVHEIFFILPTQVTDVNRDIESRKKMEEKKICARNEIFFNSLVTSKKISMMENHMGQVCEREIERQKKDSVTANEWKENHARNIFWYVEGSEARTQRHTYNSWNKYKKSYKSITYNILRNSFRISLSVRNKNFCVFTPSRDTPPSLQISKRYKFPKTTN